MKLHSWSFYTEKLRKRITQPLNVGWFSQKEADEKALLLGMGEEGSMQEENILRFYLLVDPEDGVIADARFQAFGDTALIAAADALCEIVLRKNVLQARRVHTELIEKKFEEKNQPNPFPKETYSHLNLALSALENALVSFSDLEIEDPHSVSPVESLTKESGKSYPDFELLIEEEKLKVIQEVIKVEIEPYIALDNGGIEVKELKGNEVIIIYSGACTSCYSATGATLSAIEKILRDKLSSQLFVTPDQSVLNF